MFDNTLKNNEMDLGIGVIKKAGSERPSLQTEHLTELVCPVCYEYMHPPIMLCEQGHSICELCHELMLTCPLCQGKLTCRRSSTLEALTAVMKFPCKRCGKKFALGELETHNCFQAAQNDYSPLATCIVGQVYGECMWSGTIPEMLPHYSKQHGRNFFTTNEIVVRWKNSLNIGVQNVYVIDLPEATFIIVQKYDSVTNTLRWNLSCECETNETFTYEIDVNDILFNRIKIENSFNILMYFPVNNEIIIGVDKIGRYVTNEDILEYKIIIRKYGDFPIEEKRMSQTIKIDDNDDRRVDNSSCFNKAWRSVQIFCNSIKKFLHL